MQFIRLFILFFMPFSSIFSKVHHHFANNQNLDKNTYCWDENNISSFEELIISWNAPRPKIGHYSIYVSVNTGKWSPWLLYAQWGSDFQKSFISTRKKSKARVYQDAVEVLNNKVGNGFKVKIVAENGADISSIKSIHVCASNPSSISKIEPSLRNNLSYLLDVKGLSQMALIDERRNRLCSPTSTTAVVRFLKDDENLDPIQFAEDCWDFTFDIFGNWVFNVVEAYNQIKNLPYSCWVERLDNFQNILDSLENGFPVVISVRGPLQGSAQPYKNGHLLAIIGYDSKANEVICMDPAFNTNEETIVRYKLNDLLEAWSRRKNVAYIFANSKN